MRYYTKTSGALLVLLMTAQAVVAQSPLDRPTAMRLFPREAVLFLRTADAGLFVERSRETGLGAMLRDPQMSAFVEELYGGATDAYNDHALELLQTDLDQLWRLPQGEVAFALVERPQRRPALLLLADFRDQANVVRQLMDRLEELAAERGATITSEPMRNDTITLLRDGNNEQRVVGVVQRDTTFLVGTDRDLLQSVLDRWDGLSAEDTAESADDESDDSQDDPPPFQETLAENPVFANALRECLPAREEPPQAMFFVDPVGMIRAIGGRSTGVRVAMATFPALGIDGIQGVAGTLWIATEKWDSLARAHLLLENPRTGVLKVARLEPGDLTPPSFIPVGIENYLGVHANASRVFDEIAMLVDRFRYEGSFRKMVQEKISEKAGFDFEAEFINNLAGNLYLLSGYDESQRDINGRLAGAVKVKDVEQAKEILSKLAEKSSGGMRGKTLGKAEYYALGPERSPDDNRPAPPITPALGLLGDHIVFSFSEDFFARMVAAEQGADKRFVDSLQHRLIVGRLKRLSGGREASIMAMHDDGPAYRHWHRLATDEANREQLNELAENNRFFRVLCDALENNELPPIETILQYTAPGGSVVIDTDTGFHMISFGFKRTK